MRVYAPVFVVISKHPDMVPRRVIFLEKKLFESSLARDQRACLSAGISLRVCMHICARAGVPVGKQNQLVRGFNNRCHAARERKV